MPVSTHRQDSQVLTRGFEMACWQVRAVRDGEGRLLMEAVLKGHDQANVKLSAVFTVFFLSL